VNVVDLFTGILGGAYALWLFSVMFLGALMSLKDTKMAKFLTFGLRRLTKQDPKTLVQRLVFHFGQAMVIVVAVGIYQVILTLAPEMHRVLYDRLSDGFFSDFMPPLIFLAFLAIPAWFGIKVLDYPFAKFVGNMKDANGTVPFEDTGAGMEL